MTPSVATLQTVVHPKLGEGKSLDLVETPPGKAQEIYRALARSLRYPDHDERGLRPLLRLAQSNPGVVEQFVQQSPVPGRCPLSAALTGLVDCHSQLACDDIMNWVSGQIKPTKELRTCLRKPPTLYSAGDVARQYTYLLTSISVLSTMLPAINGSGYSGLAVLIDESEHYSLLRARQRSQADAFFKAMIYAALGLNSRVDPTSIPDHPRIDYPLAFASNPHLFFLFALTESENRMPVAAWMAPSQIIRLDDRSIERDIRVFGDTALSCRWATWRMAFGSTTERFMGSAGSFSGNV